MLMINEDSIRQNLINMLIAQGVKANCLQDESGKFVESFQDLSSKRLLKAVFWHYKGRMTIPQFLNMINGEKSLIDNRQQNNDLMLPTQTLNDEKSLTDQQSNNTIDYQSQPNIKEIAEFFKKNDIGLSVEDGFIVTTYQSLLDRLDKDIMNNSNPAKALIDKVIEKLHSIAAYTKTRNKDNPVLCDKSDSSF